MIFCNVALLAIPNNWMKTLVHTTNIYIKMYITTYYSYRYTLVLHPCLYKMHIMICYLYIGCCAGMDIRMKVYRHAFMLKMDECGSEAHTCTHTKHCSYDGFHS